MHMVKIRTTITINKDLLKKAKKHGISISSFLDIELRRYIAFIEGKQNNSLSSPPIQEPLTIDDAEGGIRTPIYW